MFCSVSEEGYIVLVNIDMIWAYLGFSWLDTFVAQVHTF